MDAPSFENIGSRRNRDWMARWIENPKALRPTASMPSVLHGPEAKDNAHAIATYLASLKSDGVQSPTKEPSAEQSATGKRLFESLHCAAVITRPKRRTTKSVKYPLKQVRQKFAPGTLPVFLQKPEAHYAWIRMPISS